MGRRSLLLALICALCAVLSGCAAGGASIITSKPPGLTASPAQSASMAGFPDFSDVVNAVRPSVVAVEADKMTMEDSSEVVTQIELGSGWVLDEQAIITNSHVIEGAVAVRVEFSDGQKYQADAVYADPVTDLAVIIVKTDEKLQPIPVADTSVLEVGNWVLAMGNPVGKGISAKPGIISRLGVTMSPDKGRVYSNLIETSAPLNRGNSGGPLINVQGQVIGINTLKIDEAGVEGMGYAINITDALPIIQVLSAGQRVQRAWLGVDVLTFDNSSTAMKSPDVNRGALVTTVFRDSPASKAGITTGNVITSYNDRTVTGADDLIGLSNLTLPGQKVKITFWQGRTAKTREITLENQPASIPSPTSSNTSR